MDSMTYGVVYDLRTPYFRYKVNARKEIKLEILKKLKMSEQVFWSRLRGDYKIMRASELKGWKEILKVEDIGIVGQSVEIVGVQSDS